MPPKRVLVIGAGLYGLVSISSLKAEGIEPVCYEWSNNYGGTWYYRQETKYGQASLMPTTSINHSKEMGAMSNFPPRKEFNIYMRHSELYQYITEYVQHFDCEKHIQYNMEVVHVKKALDYDVTGRWMVTAKNLTTGEATTDTFDGVIVATGHNNRPLIPEFPSQGKFKGEIIHTHSLKEVERYTDKTVVVVGMGCSALDAAVEISRVAKQVYLSSRSGSFILNRVGRHGNPFDTIMLRRCFTMLMDILPIDFACWYVETFLCDVIFDHRGYYCKPKYHVLSKEPSLNDHIPSKLLSGLVIQKGDIKEFSETAVLFDGEDVPTEVDAVVMGTGYSWGFPFLEDGIVTTDENRINLYKRIYPPHLPHPTLAFIGFFNPYGAGFPIAEMQSRWAAYLFAGKGCLPSEDIMMKDIIEKYEYNLKRYCPSKQLSIRVDYVQYLDEIAKEIGVKPNLLKYLFTDFPLFLKLLFGPSLPYQYRLEGHGEWKGAREALMMSEERTQWPLRRKHAVKKSFIRYLIEYIVNIIPLNADIWG